MGEERLQRGEQLGVVLGVVGDQRGDRAARAAARARRDRAAARRSAAGRSPPGPTATPPGGRRARPAARPRAAPRAAPPGPGAGADSATCSPRARSRSRAPRRRIAGAFVERRASPRTLPVARARRAAPGQSSATSSPSSVAAAPGRRSPLRRRRDRSPSRLAVGEQPPRRRLAARRRAPEQRAAESPQLALVGLAHQRGDRGRGGGGLEPGRWPRRRRCAGRLPMRGDPRRRPARPIGATVAGAAAPRAALPRPRRRRGISATLLEITSGGERVRRPDDRPPSAGSAIATGRPSASDAEQATRSRSSPATAPETIVSGVDRGAVGSAPRSSAGCGLLSSGRARCMRPRRRASCRSWLTPLVAGWPGAPASPGSRSGTRATARRTGTPRGRARRCRRSPCSPRTSATG